jgi:hypothetical protein
MATVAWPAMAAAIVAMLGGTLGGYHFMQYSAADAVRREANEARRRVEGTAVTARAQHDPQRLPDAKEERDAAAVHRQAETNRPAQSAAAQRKAEEEAAARAQSQAQRKSLAEAEAKHEEQAHLAEDRAQAEAIRVAEAARQRAEADRIAAEDAARQRAEAQRVAAVTLSAEDRASFVRRVQEVLKASHCSDGAINGSSSDAQKGVDRFVETARKQGKDKPKPQPAISTPGCATPTTSKQIYASSPNPSQRERWLLPRAPIRPQGLSGRVARKRMMRQNQGVKGGSGVGTAAPRVLGLAAAMAPNECALLASLLS